MYDGALKDSLIRDEIAMKIHIQQSLFPWDALDDSPAIRTIQLLLDAMPDAELIRSLDEARGRGRNDYPSIVLWRTLLLQIVLRHNSMDACLEELRRNSDLRRLLGPKGELIEEDDVPKAWNMTRFLAKLGDEPHRSLLVAIFNRMIKTLGTCVDDLGENAAGDATHLHGRPLRSKADLKREAKSDLPQPNGGRKEYTDDQGVVTKVVEWFGYKLHLLVDVKHEIALSYEITSATGDDGRTLKPLIETAKANLPGQRIKTVAYDKAADSGDVHKMLDSHGIAPIIHNRSMWTDEQEKMLPGHDGRSNVVYDESGTVFCYDRTSAPIVRHRMAYIGHEPSRGTIKYRCPARHEEWTCPNDHQCNAGKKYGKTLRVKQEIDLRRFPAIPRATKKFERLYKGRTSVERVNARLKIFWGADDGNTRGAARFHAQVGAVMVVHAAFATLLASLPREDGSTLSRTRLSPIAKKLRAKGTRY